MIELECIFGRYEAQIDALREENKRLRKELDDWIELATKGQAIHERAMMEMVVGFAKEK
jgi:hypothetical protein